MGNDFMGERLVLEELERNLNIPPEERTQIPKSESPVRNFPISMILDFQLLYPKIRLHLYLQNLLR